MTEHCGTYQDTVRPQEVCKCEYQAQARRICDETHLLDQSLKIVKDNDKKPATPAELERAKQFTWTDNEGPTIAGRGTEARICVAGERLKQL